MPNSAKSPLGPPVLYTVGHSTHPIERFLELLSEHRIAILADVRSFPGSRRWPQFNQESLAETLGRAGVEYRWLKGLGGRRHGRRADSPHVAWTVAAFRAYADYADSAEFAEALGELMASATGARTAIMCSEGLWWQCHRRIVADHLTVRGWTVEHIMPAGHDSQITIVDGAVTLTNGTGTQELNTSLATVSLNSYQAQPQTVQMDANTFNNSYHSVSSVAKYLGKNVGSRSFPSQTRRSRYSRIGWRVSSLATSFTASCTLLVDSFGIPSCCRCFVIDTTSASVSGRGAPSLVVIISRRMSSKNRVPDVLGSKLMA